MWIDCYNKHGGSELFLKHGLILIMNMDKKNSSPRKITPFH